MNQYGRAKFLLQTQLSCTIKLCSTNRTIKISFLDNSQIVDWKRQWSDGPMISNGPNGYHGPDDIRYIKMQKNAYEIICRNEPRDVNNDKDKSGKKV